MRSVKFLIAAGAVTLSTAAFAADLPIAAPPMYAPPPPAEFGGWYLRGDIGMTNQSIKSLTNTDPNAAAFTSNGIGFDSAMLWDIGVGYQLNSEFSSQNVAGVLAWTIVFWAVMVVIEYGVLQSLERASSKWRRVSDL